MIGVDTNFLVRLAVADDETQLAQSVAFIRTHVSADIPLLVNSIVLCEFVWVLTRIYRLPTERVAENTERFLDSPAFQIQDEALVRSAVSAMRSGFDFADVLIGGVNKSLGASSTVTFDKRAQALDGFEPVA